MPSFEVEFEVYCGTCGAGLCNVSDTRASKSRGMPQVTVEACAKCMENAKQEGRKEAEAEYAQEHIKESL